eukprot:1828612-Prymnesium_polylepis.1
MALAKVPKAYGSNGSNCLAPGLYIFFIIFGLTMLGFQLSIQALSLWMTGYVPEIILVARAHA